jgi:hypothetical protein
VTTSHTPSSIAAIVLAHNDPAQIQRLLKALDPVPVFLHCDAATPRTDFARMMAGAHNGVSALERIRTARGAWSLVQIELNGLRIALERTDAEYIALMSGGCYPLLSMPALEAELASTPGQSRLNYWALPYGPWANRLGQDGGLWRLKYRYLSRAGRPVTLGGRPIPTGRARVPEGLRLHGGSHFKVYAREHAQRLLAVLDAHPELVRFFRSSFIPEESCVQSVLNSPAFVGELAEQIVSSDPWFLSFPTSAAEGQDAHGHGDWLDASSFTQMQATSDPSGGGRSPFDRALFARKFRSASAPLLDRVDVELRARTA